MLATSNTETAPTMIKQLLLANNAFLIFVLGLATLANAQGGLHRNTTSQLLATFKGLEVQDADEVELTTQGQWSEATFGTGCFWCTEAIFEQLKGVKRVVSGYSGGMVPNPTYEQVLTGRTGHAEVVHIEFDPTEVSFSRLLEAFWLSHDPTTLNRQGVDVGTQYRSVVFYHDDQQRKTAERYKSELNESKAFRKPIVTEIAKFEAFYPAKGYHQDYFAENGRQPYCQLHIRPKLKKFKRVFRDHLNK